MLSLSHSRARLSPLLGPLLGRAFSAEMHGTTILCVKKDGKMCMIGKKSGYRSHGGCMGVVWGIYNTQGG